MMIGAGVSRWTMLHLGAAVVALLVAQLLLVLGYADLLGALRSPATLIAVHLITIGWLSLMMMGALYQFVPVITNTPLYSQRLPLAAFICLVTGLAGMIAGFLALSGAPIVDAACLPLGGALVLAGFVLGITDIAATLWRARPLPMPALFVAAGLCFLLLTGTVGLLFALAFVLSSPPAFLTALAQDGLLVHVAGGLGGWFTLTAMGVSYRLLSMFMLAPDKARWTSYASLVLTPLGLLALMAGIVVGLDGNAAGQAVAVGGAIFAVLGIGFYLTDIVHLYLARKRKVLELNSIAAAVALAFLAVTMLAGLLVALSGGLDRLAGALGYLFVFGWLSGLGLSQLYKIVPFLTWLEVFGKKLGKGPVPRVQDLVEERRAAPWFSLYFLSVLICASAMALNQPHMVSFAMATQWLATAFIALELWRARHPDPNAAPKPMAKGAALPFARPAAPRSPTPTSTPIQGG